MLALIILAAVVACLMRTVPADMRIVDGDTIVVRGRRWRLAGYDAPEHDQPGGTEATEHLRQILAQGAIGMIVGQDVYGRRVVRIFTRRGPLAWRMILAGHAHADTMLGVLPMLAARLARRGVWGMGHHVVSPSMWRAMRPTDGRRTAKTRHVGSARRPRAIRTRYNARTGLNIGGFTLP